MNRSELITIGVILSIVAGAALFTWYRVSNQSSVVSDTFGAADSTTEIQLYDLNDRPVSLDQFAGKPLVVNSWASWCPFCTTELPDLEQLAIEYADAEVAVLAINRAEPLRTQRSYLRSVALDTGTQLLFLQDPADGFYKEIGGITMPETVFYNADGEVVVHKRGFMEIVEMRRHVETALSKTN